MAYFQSTTFSYNSEGWGVTKKTLIRILFLHLLIISTAVYASRPAPRTKIRVKDAISYRPMFGGDLANTSYFSLGLVSIKNKRIPKVRTEDRVALVFTAMHTGVSAHDIKTGKEIWRFREARGVLGQVVVVEGVAYFCSGNSRLYALEAMTGKKKWEFAAQATLETTPSVFEGTVFFWFQ